MARKYDLVGVNGNVYSVIGYVQDCMRAEGLPNKDIEAFKDECMQCKSYEKVLCKAIDKIDILNIRYED